MKTLSLILVPALIGAVCAAILALVHHQTQPVIREVERQNAVAAARRVLPEHFPAPVETNLNGVACFASFDAAGRLLGVALDGATDKGYGGEIRLMVGITSGGVVHSFKVLSAEGETPGLGSKIKSDAFRESLSGRPVSGNWLLKKDQGEIDAITAATISSRAALDAIRDAIAKYETASGTRASSP